MMRFSSSQKHLKNGNTIVSHLICLLLYLSIFCAPLRCYGILIAGFNFSFFRIFGILMIVLYVFFDKIYFDKISKIIAVLVIITLFQVCYSPYLSGSVSNFFSFFFGFVWVFFAYLIISRKQLFEKAKLAMIASAIFPLLLGLYQWYIYRATGSVPPLPFSFLISSEGKTGLTFNVYARISSCFGDPAYMSTFYVAIFAISMQSLVATKGRMFLKILYAIICTLIILEIVMSISFSGIIGLFTSLLFILLFNIRNRGILKRLLIIYTVFAVSFVIFFAKYGTQLSEALLYKANNGAETVSNLFGRSEYIENALYVWSQSPLLGCGFGSLRLGNSFSSAHSSLLTVLGQQGLLVFVINLALLIYYPAKMLIGLRKKYQNSNKQSHYSSYIGYLVALASTLCVTLGYDTLYSLDSCYVLIAVVLSFYNSSVLISTRHEYSKLQFN